jgi:hypothetical protein
MHDWSSRTVTFLIEKISTLVTTELRTAACSSWQTLNQSPAKYQFARMTYPAVRYRRTIVTAGLTLEEHDGVVTCARHAWRMNRA